MHGSADCVPYSIIQHFNLATFCQIRMDLIVGVTTPASIHLTHWESGFDDQICSVGA